MKYKYEFEADDFTKGNCLYCPLSHWGYDDKKHFGEMCVLGSSKEDCPLDEVEDSGEGVRLTNEISNLFKWAEENNVTLTIRAGDRLIGDIAIKLGRKGCGEILKILSIDELNQSKVDFLPIVLEDMINTLDKNKEVAK